jgi:hypothetical protein
MSNDTEVMSVPSNDSPELVVSDKSIEMIIAEAEKRVTVLKKVLGVAIKRTNPTDWIDQQGKPYLGASGCEKVAPLFGLKMEGVVSQRDEREDEKGRYYIYTFMARFYWAAGDIEAIGTCSSRDKFFAWDSTKKEYKPLYDVDETNIKKAAYSNLTVNGVTRALGIRSLTWADLEPFGIKKDSVSKVEYNKGAESDAGQQGLISEAQVKRFHAIASKAGWGDSELKEWLMKNYKIDSSTKISWKNGQYDAICIACQKAKGIEPGA